MDQLGQDTSEIRADVPRNLGLAQEVSRLGLLGRNTWSFVAPEHKEDALSYYANQTATNGQGEMGADAGQLADRPARTSPH